MTMRHRKREQNMKIIAANPTINVKNIFFEIPEKISDETKLNFEEDKNKILP